MHDLEFSQSEVLLTPNTSASAEEIFVHTHRAILPAFPLDDMSLIFSDIFISKLLQNNTKHIYMLRSKENT